MCKCEEIFWDAVACNNTSALRAAIARLRARRHSFHFVNEVDISAVFWAVFSKNLAALEMLCDIDEVDLNIRNHRSHDTPLHSAIKRGYFTIAKKLWTNGADPNVKNKVGLTPFALACKLEKYNIAIVMLRDLAEKIDFCATDRDGNTCLHYFPKKLRNAYEELARTKKNPQILTLRALLYYGLRGNVKNNRGVPGLPVWPPRWELSAKTVKLFPRTFSESLIAMQKVLSEKLPEEVVCQCIDRASRLAWQ